MASEDDTPAAKGLGTDPTDLAPTAEESPESTVLAAPPRSPSMHALAQGVRGALFEDAPLPSHDYTPGQTLGGRYRILGLLGRGGMGVVYRAHDIVLGEEVAIKFLPAEVATRPDYLERFAREVRTARKVSHPNVCRVHDIGEVDGRRFLSMEYVDGEDLASLLRRIGRFEHSKAVELAHQLCAGLAALHDQGILHRDLKPSNVMIDGEGRVKLADFGLASLANELGAHEIRDGTPAYQAPEQARGEAVTERSDIYALGLILREMFGGGGATEEGSTTAVDPDVQELIDRCLERNPERRPASVRSVALGLPGGDVFGLLAGGRLMSADAVADAPTAGGLSSRTAWLLALAALVLLMVTAGFQSSSSALTIDPPLAAAVLEHRADELMTRFAPDHEHRTVFATYDDEALERQTLDDGEPATFSRPVLVVLRGAQRRIPPLGNQTTLDDPPARSPGLATVIVDGQGDLRGLLIVPTADAKLDRSAPPPVDWDALLEAAGVDPDQAEAVEPTMMPPLLIDAQTAWEVEDGRVRIEAGALDGQPVWMHVEVEGDEQERVDGLLTMAARIFGGVLAVSLLLGFPFVVIRSLREGNFDATGSRRLGSIFIVLILIEIFADPNGLVLTGSFLIYGLGRGLLVALAYAVIEPYVRRAWPRALVAWNRMLRGRLTDPMVGRDLLIGLLIGGAGALLVTATAGARGEAIIPSLEAWAGGTRVLGPLASSLAFGTSLSMILLAGLSMVERVVKRRELAFAVVVLGATGLGAADGTYDGLLRTLLSAGLLVVLLNFGLLAGAFAASFGLMATELPLSTQDHVTIGTSGTLSVGFLLMMALCFLAAWLASRSRPRPASERSTTRGTRPD